MDCSCQIYTDIDNGPSAFSVQNRKARKQHKCCECLRTIEKGEMYRYESGIWDGPMSFKTCEDCLSLREAYFCSFVFEGLYEYLDEEIREAGDYFLDSRIQELTERAKQYVFDKIESMWEKG
jgi:hypothetical protein